ncbi:hypothetical protein, partial [Pseudomonas syringae]|uniref:hypothetical protein n=1 Tax=Pseudomonas syringae TaxID=317 RepID=UPI0024E106CB
DDELADIKLEGCIEFSVFLGHDDSSMGVVSPIEVSGVIRPAQKPKYSYTSKPVKCSQSVAYVGASLLANCRDRQQNQCPQYTRQIEVTDFRAASQPIAAVVTS